MCDASPGRTRSPALSTLLDILTTSTNHHDACFRMLQYTCRLLACTCFISRKRMGELQAIASSIDASRTMNRSFGALAAARALANRKPSCDFDFALASARDGLLFSYHVAEVQYYALLACGSSRAAYRRSCSRLSSAFALAWNICYGISLCRRLHARRNNGAATKGGELQKSLLKLLLDSILALHWSVDGPSFELREWQVALCGSISASLGLVQQLSNHAHSSMQRDVHRGTGKSKRIANEEGRKDGNESARERAQETARIGGGTSSKVKRP